jgi:hypothetical protein
MSSSVTNMTTEDTGTATSTSSAVLRLIIQRDLLIHINSSEGLEQWQTDTCSLGVIRVAGFTVASLLPGSSWGYFCLSVREHVSQSDNAM